MDKKEIAKQLREETNCSLMDCIKALNRNNNNYELAKQWLIRGEHLRYTI